MRGHRGHREDRRDKLADGVFSYHISKDKKVFVSYRGKRVTILTGNAAADFARKVADADPTQAQLVMAKVTGNFKRGNEKS